MVLHSMYWKESSFLSSSSPFKPSLLGHSWPHKNENSQEREPRGSYCLCWLVARRRGPLAPRGTLAAAGHTRVRWSTRPSGGGGGSLWQFLTTHLWRCSCSWWYANLPLRPATAHAIQLFQFLSFSSGFSPLAASYMSMTQNRNLRAEKLCCCCSCA